MNTGTQAAREAGNMVDLDSNPTKLIEIVEIGKQLLITRGSLTTFSIAQQRRQVLRDHPGDVRRGRSRCSMSSTSCSWRAAEYRRSHSAVIFNTLVIVALIPLALRGVRFRAGLGGRGRIRRNLLIYGLGGLVVPFVGIKLIDLVVGGLGVV